MYYRITFSHVFTWLPNSNKGLLRAVLLTMVCVIAASWFPTTAQAAVSTVALGCRASATGGNLSIPINSSVGEGATIVVAIQVVARNEDITSVSDLGVGGNTYTRLVKHLGIVIGPVGNQENDTLHMYAAFDAKALNSGQPINIVWNFSNGLEACAVAVYGLQRTPFDKSAASHASSASPNSGNTATTALANEVLLGAFGWFCHQNGSLCNANATSGSGYSEIIEGADVMIEYRTVNTTGAYNAGATLNLSSDWNAGIVTFKVDSTAPTVTSMVNGTQGNNGWYRSNAVVSWNVTDPESRVITTCNPTTISTDTTGTALSCQATSAGGTTSGSITVKRDTVPPTITAAGAPAPNANGWNNTNVTVNFTCNDTTSGLAGSCPANQVLSSEGAAVSSSAQTATDQAGNQSAPSNVVTAKIDKTAPTISAAATTSPNAAGWYNNNVTIHFTCFDALSGVVTCPADEVLSSEGHTVASTAQTVSDQAGNQGSVTYTVSVDKTAPTVVVTGVSDNATYPLGSVPVAGCSTTDALSSVATDATISITGGGGDGTGVFTAACNGATDKADNSAAAVSVTYTVNAPAASLTIVLDVRPNISSNLSFNGSVGQFVLDDPAADDGDAHPNQRTFTVAPGNYTVRRSNATHWFTTAIECTPNTGATVDLAQHSVTLTVSNGDNVTCTFVVERPVTIIARAFNDLVRNSTNLGKRNAGDPWLQNWTMSVYTAPNTLVVSGVTTVTTTANLYQARFANLLPGSYTVCTTLPTTAWVLTAPTAPDPAYGLPCKAITLAPGQSATLLFGAYLPTVVASDAGTAEAAPITDDDQISDQPADLMGEENLAAEEKTPATETSAPSALANRLFLPLVNR